MADGGSIDNTIEIAQSFPNVEIRHFTEKVQLDNGYWRNPDSSHANFLFEWAYSLNPDWIIYDDCDCRPNYLLKQDYRNILSVANYDFVMAVRIYLYENNQHFPLMAQPAGKWEASLWAWRGNIDFWTVDAFPHYTFRIGDKNIADLNIDAKTMNLYPPYCLLHCSWDTEENTEKKVKYHREFGLMPKDWHPKKFAGDPKPLEEWMHE